MSTEPAPPAAHPSQPSALRPSRDEPVAICARRLVVGVDQLVVDDGAVVVRNGLIDYIGPASTADLPGIEHRWDFGDATVLPGLIDAHVHLSMRSGEDLDAYGEQPGDVLAERLRITRAQLLERGITTVRDLGCRKDVLPVALRPSPERLTRVIASGPPITSPRGHFWPLSLEVRGSDQVRAAVAELHSLGAGVIKVMATGGAMTPGTAMGRAQFDLEELTAAVDEAHARGLRVAAHAHGTEGIELAVAAGVDTIEHCSWTDADSAVTQPVPELLDAMAANGQVIVSAGPLSPDLLAWFETGTLPDTPKARRQIALWRNARVAAQHGVTVALATDSVFGAVPAARDLEYRVRALVGLLEWPVLDALQMVTGNAAAALGDSSRGRLAVGAVADIAVFPGDLTADPAGLSTPLAVWKDGKRVDFAVAMEGRVG